MNTKSLLFCLVFIAIQYVSTTPTGFIKRSHHIGLGQGFGLTHGNRFGLLNGFGSGLGFGPTLFNPGFIHNGLSPGFVGQGLGWGPAWSHQPWGSGHGIGNGLLFG